MEDNVVAFRPCRMAVAPVPALRFDCRILHRRRAAEFPPARLVFQRRRGFLEALAGIYEADFSSYERVVVVERLQIDAHFALDADYRRHRLDQLCRSTLEDGGFLLLHPTHDMWRHDDTTPAPITAGAQLRRSVELSHLFGSCGFAQLCDDDLGRPVPVLVAPGCGRRGLLPPARLPRERFSRSLRVHRLGPKRMILFGG